MRCGVLVAGDRCVEEEGHDTGVGTPHRFPPPTPVSAEDAARELSQRMGVPCTAVPVVAPDDGDVTCAQADDTPEGAAIAMDALAAAVDRADADTLEVRQANRRGRVLGAILAYLHQSEGDWQSLAATFGGDAAVAIGDAKHLHDAQVKELFERIGAVL